MHSKAMRRTAAFSFCALMLAGALAGCGSKKPSTVTPDVGPVTNTPPPVTTSPEPAKPTEPTPAKPVDPRPAPKLPGTIGIMVENSFQARPQAGLDKADIVYELEAEYGITRFLALFYREPAEKVGPVRSARMGFYDIAVAHGVPYAHAGGNNDVLGTLKEGHASLLNIDEIYTCGGCFWRSDARVAPHNLYTSTERIVNQGKNAGFTLRPLNAYSEGAAPQGGKPAPEIAFHWGGDSMRASWTWNGQRYERSQESKPHVMESGARIQADTVVMLFTTYKWDQAAQWGEGQNNISIVGSGSGYLYRGGQVWPITWKKPSREQHYTLTMADGTPVPLAYGQTWFEVLKSTDHVTKGLPE